MTLSYKFGYLISFPFLFSISMNMSYIRYLKKKKKKSISVVFLELYLEYLERHSDIWDTVMGFELYDLKVKACSANE